MDLKDTLGVFPGTLDRTFCNELIDIFEKNKQYHYQGVTASGYDPGYKDTTDFNLLDNPDLKEYTDHITRMSNQKIEEYIQRFPQNDEFNTAQYLFRLGTYYPVWQLQKYKKNEGHFRAYHTEGEYWEFHNRIFAVMFYLNDVEEGGETEFPLQDLVFKPKAGTFLIWPAPWPFVHRGNVPLSNDKYILTTWLLRKG